MTKISHEEVMKLARISQIWVDEHDSHVFASQLQAVLNYAQRVEEVAQMQSLLQEDKAINVVRPDEIRPGDPALILGQAPHEQEGYFVVPRILDNH